jgi:polysaccharide biosynthesis transport protein
MSEETNQENPSGGISVADIYFVLFRRKWIIITFALLGVAAAGLLFAIKPPKYRSEAKLFIRYVVEPSSVAAPGSVVAQRSLSEQAASILNAEGQFLKSKDVAQQVVDAVGAAKILAKVNGGTNRDDAVDLVINNLEIELMLNNGNVIALTFQHPDPEMAKAVLTQIIDAYVKKQKEMRRPVGMYGELVKETERLTTSLALTDQQLREAKARIGGVDIAATKKDYADQIARIREQLFVAQTDLAKRQASLAEMPKPLQTQAESTNSNSEVDVPLEQIRQYRSISAEVERLTGERQVLDRTYEPTSQYVTQKQKEIDEAVQKKGRLERQFPKLASLAFSAPAAAGQSVVPVLDAMSEAAQIKVLQSTTNFLYQQLAQVQSDAGKLDETEGVILNLQRTKELQESDLKYFRGNMEAFRMDDSLGEGKAANIGVVDPPSNAVKAWPKSFKKKVQMVGVGGLFAGIGLAFLIEMFLDRSVKRPVDVERKLKLPLFISIPDISNGNGRSKISGKEPLRLTDARADAKSKSVPPAGTPVVPIPAWDRNHPLRSYYSGLRDRLITYFEVRNLNQKPKLVAVTSCGKGVGVSSIAAGLAASLSETGDGNVLLVDLSHDQNASQRFHKGKPSQELDEALANDTMKSALVQAESSVAGQDKSQLPQVFSKRFANIMPKLKSNEYDYIIFDMPAVSQTSTTPRMTRVMDMVLLVVESEKTSQDVVKQAMALLAESKANVSAVLNKTHSYVPSQLHQELNDV